MRKQEKFTQFQRDSLLKYPDPHAYKSVKDRSFWALHVLQKELLLEQVTASDIAEFLTEKIHISTSAQAVSYALNNAPRGCVNKKNGCYKLMHKGRETINLADKNGTEVTPENTQLYINPGTPYSGKTLFIEQVLPEFKGEIKICDPYIGARLLDILAKGDKANSIQILTNQIEDKPIGSFKRTLEDINKEGYTLNVRIYEASELHDRYIISDSGMWVIGHSIKDLGKKESFIFKVNDDIKMSLKPVFDRRWSISKPV